MGNLTRMEEAVSVLLEELGEDIHREGLVDTPTRVAKMFYELTKGTRTDPPHITTFSSDGLDQMITVLDIDFNTLCEHHMVPVYGKVHIGYLPGERIAGLSKFARIVDWFSARLQIQENLTAQIADHIQEVLEPRGVIVLVEATHMCMSMRGVKKPNHVTVTSALRGDIPKEEFFDILHARRG